MQDNAAGEVHRGIHSTSRPAEPTGGRTLSTEVDHHGEGISVPPAGRSSGSRGPGEAVIQVGASRQSSAGEVPRWINSTSQPMAGREFSQVGTTGAMPKSLPFPKSSSAPVSRETSAHGSRPRLALGDATPNQSPPIFHGKAGAMAPVPGPVSYAPGGAKPPEVSEAPTGILARMGSLFTGNSSSKGTRRE